MAEVYGAECRKEFMLDPTHSFTNHGSYGSVPKVVYDKRLELMRIQESNPDLWFRRLCRPLYDENIEVAAKFIGADPKNLVVVPNTTSGINSVIKSVPFTSSDAILVNTFTYKAIQNVCQSAMDRVGGKVLDVDVSLPIKSSAHIVEKYRDVLKQNPNIKLVVIDLISSATATRWPLHDLVALCREHNALVLVDGAHAPGQVKLDMEGDMAPAGVDFFIGNFHKWVFVPRGCAVVWVHPRHHNTIRPVVTSHLFNAPTLQDDFFTQGTVDHTTLFTLKDGVEYYNSKGGLDKIIAHNTSLADRVVEMLLEKWGTYKFPIPADMEAPFMRLVRVPDLTAHPVPEEFKKVPFHGWLDMQNFLTSEYRLSAQVLIVCGQPWVRISAQIYNSMDDYKRLGEVFKELAEGNLGRKV